MTETIERITKTDSIDFVTCKTLDSSDEASLLTDSRRYELRMVERVSGWRPPALQILGGGPMWPITL
jgi:hypothetical protein